MSFDLRIRDGDLAIGSDGDFERVEGTEKLVQDILKILITRLGSNLFYPWYGSLISQTLIGQVLDTDLTNAAATNQIQNALESLQRIQQEQSLRQRVSPFEQLAAIRRIKVIRNRVDPRFYSIGVEVATRALTTREINFEVNIAPRL